MRKAIRYRARSGKRIKFEEIREMHQAFNNNQSAPPQHFPDLGSRRGARQPCPHHVFLVSQHCRFGQL